MSNTDSNHLDDLVQNYLIIGQGKIGVQVSNQMSQHGYPMTGMARKPRDHYRLDENVNFIQADATHVSSEQLVQFTHICIIVTASMSGEEGYKDSYLAIAEHIASLRPYLTKLQRLVFISSTGVYGQNSGEWIDESTPITKPKRSSSQVILQAEQVLQSAFAEKAIIIRPSGIYGKSRLMRVRQARETNKTPIAEYAWTNRIMDTDLVNIISKVLTIVNPKPVYIATDYQTVTSLVVSQWLCEQLSSEQPKIDKNLAPSGKRLHSNVPLEWLEFPDWQSGYTRILANL